MKTAQIAQLAQKDESTEALEFIETLYSAIEQASIGHSTKCAEPKNCSIMVGLADLSAQLAVLGIALMAKTHLS